MIKHRLTIYEKPTCSTCRKTAALLRARGVEFDSIDYTVDPLSAEKLRELIDKAGVPARDFLRPREAHAIGITGLDHDDDELIALMAKHPSLVQRPIAEYGDRATLGRPPDRILDLLGMP